MPTRTHRSTRRLLTLCAAGVLLGGLSAAAEERGQHDCGPIGAGDGAGVGLVLLDPPGDACIRRTDAGTDGVLAGATPPDLLRFRMTGWQPQSASDPFTGVPDKAQKTGILRIDLTFAGLVSPPGRVDATGWSHNPVPFGGTSVYGFAEINVDRDRDTGGELGAAARIRFLANVARFGVLPSGGMRERAAKNSGNLDENFATSPQFERSGADFAVTFCGCENPQVLSAGGNGDNTFDPGEVWLLRGRYLQRSSGYRDASGVFGGSDFGLYDPYITLRVEHSIPCNETTFSIVYPLTPEGAAFLVGEPVQPVDEMIGFGSHFSMQEAIQDLIWGAEFANGGWYSTEVRTLVERWKGRHAEDFLDPSRWRASAIFGMSYLRPEPSLYAWTDIGFNLAPLGDLNNDGIVDDNDEKIFLMLRDDVDGTSDDADGVVNGVVVIPNFGPNFRQIDFDGDGVIGPRDLALYAPPCPADFNRDTIVDVADLFGYINAWLAKSPDADFNGDSLIDVADLFSYINAWLAKC